MRLTSIGFAIALMTGLPAEANLLTNGSFETGPNPGSFTNFAAGSTAITGWTVSTPGNIDYIGSLWVAANGSRSLDLGRKRRNLCRSDELSWRDRAVFRYDRRSSVHGYV